MNVVMLDRGAGKTTIMLNWLRQGPDRVLLVHCFEVALQLQYRYRREFGVYADDRILSVTDDFRAKLFRRRDLTIGIDNLDLVLPLLFGQPVEIVTMSP